MMRGESERRDLRGGDDDPPDPEDPREMDRRIDLVEDREQRGAVIAIAKDRRGDPARSRRAVERAHEDDSTSDPHRDIAVLVAKTHRRAGLPESGLDDGGHLRERRCRRLGLPTWRAERRRRDAKVGLSEAGPPRANRRYVSWFALSMPYTSRSV